MRINEFEFPSTAFVCCPQAKPGELSRVPDDFQHHAGGRVEVRAIKPHCVDSVEDGYANQRGT